jgi:hypothetical protein
MYAELNKVQVEYIAMVIKAFFKKSLWI